MSATQNQYSIGLDKTPANFVALTPLSFLARTAAIYPDHISAVYEGRVFTWAQTYARCRRFASYLAGRDIGCGDTVAAMLPNIPAMNELHFAVPMAGAVLNALNIRLDAASIAFQLDHGGAKIILVDPEFSGVIAEALTLMKGQSRSSSMSTIRLSPAENASAKSNMRTRCRKAIPALPQSCRRTNGTPLRSVILRAPRAIPRAW